MPTGSSRRSQPVKPEQRFTADDPCPICGGHQGIPAGNPGRCFGFRADDGTGVVCTEEESARLAGASEGWFHSTDERPQVAYLPDRTNGSDMLEIYPYRDEDGDVLFEVVRTPDKTFKQRTPDGSWGINGVPLVPYRLPGVIDAVRAGKTIYVVEGEKDVHAVERASGVATCNPMGAGKWRDEFADYFTGAHVVIVQDDDKKGQAHARQVRTSLLPVAESVVVVEAASGKDAYDHLEAGHSLDDFTLVPPRFETVDLVAYEPEEAEWLYEPILLAKTHTSIVAGTGSGNTMLALLMAHEVAQNGGRVVYLDQENGPDVLKERARALGYTNDDLALVTYFPYPNASKDELNELVVEVALRGPTLVVVDPKINFLVAADLDEDSATDTTTWHTTVVLALRQLVDTAVIEFDHMGHNSKRSRGSSAKAGHAQAEWIFEVDRRFDRDTTATATLTRGAKNRRAMLPARLQYTMGGDGKDRFIFRRLDTPDVDDAQVARRRQVRHDVIATLTKHGPLSGNKLEEFTPGDTKITRQAYKDLANTPNSGVDVRRKGNGFEYYLTEDEA